MNQLNRCYICKRVEYPISSGLWIPYSLEIFKDYEFSDGIYSKECMKKQCGDYEFLFKILEQKEIYKNLREKC